ncbi:hypothetical protein GCM10025864_23580 [Luteimicrobium album]|uniref:Uncharacterized protein n=1 Tax=Luteimicrobium album TaxID=1054550 RepID=A0ABQ6I3Q4_9MICO|nr:hypothetical protein GCM10025864_23580 [Luteimicrobium album]
MLGPDVVVVQHPRLFLGEDDHPTGSVGETFEHVLLLTSGVRLRATGLTASTLVGPNELHAADLPVFATGGLATRPGTRAADVSDPTLRRRARRRPLRQHGRAEHRTG